MIYIIGKDRDPLMGDPLFSILVSLMKTISSLSDSYISLLSLIKAILSLIDHYISSLSLIKSIFQRVSKWGSLYFPMNVALFDQDAQETL